MIQIQNRLYYVIFLPSHCLDAIRCQGIGRYECKRPRKQYAGMLMPVYLGLVGGRLCTVKCAAKCSRYNVSALPVRLSGPEMQIVPPPELLDGSKIVCRFRWWIPGCSGMCIVLIIVSFSFSTQSLGKTLFFANCELYFLFLFVLTSI